MQLVAPLGEHHCYFTSIAQVEPGGSLPPWFTNSFARRYAPRALLRLEAAAQRAAPRRHALSAKPSPLRLRGWMLGRAMGWADRGGKEEQDDDEGALALPLPSESVREVTTVTE